MKEEYSSMFDKLDPQKSDEELLQAVLSEKEDNVEKKKRSKKAVIIPAIAAAVICVTTVGVSAANNWDLPTAIKSLFKTSEGKGEIKYDVDGIGSKKLDERFERDGYTIDLLWVVADKHTSFLLYDLIIDEDHVFKNDVTEHVYSTDDTVCLTVWQNSQNYLKMIEDHLDSNRLPNGAYDFEEFDITQLNTNDMDMVLEQEGNIYHCAHRYDIKPLSLDGNELAFDLNGLNITPVNDNIFVETDVCDIVTIKYDFVNDSEDDLIDINEPFTFEDETYTLNTIELTPLSVYLRISQSKEEISSEDMYEFADNSIKIRDDVTLRLKDGSITDGEVLFGDEYEGGNSFNENGVMFSNIHLMWKRPVNVDDIESITIGDTTFDLD